MDLTNQTVFITGANRGIGKAYVEEFLKEDVKKIYLGVRDVNAVADTIAKAPEKCTAIELDITNHTQIETAASNASDTTILINNAGIIFSGSILDKDSIEHARKQFEVNYIGQLAMIQAFAPHLKNNGGGIIATVASIVSHLCFPNLGTYSASKAATHSLIMAARMELAAQNTKIIGVYPGPIDTDMNKGSDMDLFPPSLVAQKTIEALKNGYEDVFPDDVSQDFYKQACENPKILGEKTAPGD